MFKMHASRLAQFGTGPNTVEDLELRSELELERDGSNTSASWTFTFIKKSKANPRHTFLNS